MANAHNLSSGVWVLDDFLPQTEVAFLYKHAMGLPDKWIEYRHFMERKSAYQVFELLTEDWKNLVKHTRSPEFLNSLTQITGIQDLQTDETLTGAGLHRMGSGDYLSFHQDFTHHPQKPLRRCLNLIVFISPTWELQWKGNLEFVNYPGAEPCLSIQPKPGRAVLFTPEAYSFHGVPHKLSCPAETYRLTLSMFYYTIDTSIGYRKSTFYPSNQFVRLNMKVAAHVENALLSFYSSFYRSGRPFFDWLLGRILKRLF